MTDDVPPETPGVTQVVHLTEGAKSVVDSYSRYYNSFSEEKRREREENSPQITESFYELVTDFYEFGYGQSFHFGPIFEGKSNDECLEEYEREVARALNVKPGDRVLDIGCGVGGPTRTVAMETGANVVGLNISDYQLRRARMHTEKAGLKSQVSYLKGDYCNMTKIEDNSCDAVCAFESTCHSSDPLKVYREVFRVLKPGGLFVESAWAMTSNYVPGNPEHDQIKHDIMVGNSLPDIRTVKFLLSKQREAGFEIVDARECHDDGDLPWYTFLTGKGCFSIQNFRISRMGRTCTHYMLTALECVGVVPKGCTKIHEILLVAADSLTAAGKRDIFTPMLKVVARKPTE